ncbi:MAG: hypothetical protein EXS63_05295 [Candidatus Omnitrophica bacterium]|nr:hypothetical protein [Candidatus Omnitrophota bacterium]
MVTFKLGIILVCRRMFLGRHSLRKLLKLEPWIRYDQKKEIFFVVQDSMDWHAKNSMRRNITEHLSCVIPGYVLSLKDLASGYLDHCLERYLFQRNDLKKTNQDTCWHLYADKKVVVGWLDPEKEFDQKGRKDFIRELALQKPEFLDESKIGSFERDLEGFVFHHLERKIFHDEKVLKLFGKIENEGFRELLSMAKPIILGYSTKTFRYSFISGRHRAAALRYLMAKGKISPDFQIKCHLVQYPFESLSYNKPWHPLCKECDRLGVFDPDKVEKSELYV